jgi:hypothetical protein
MVKYVDIENERWEVRISEDKQISLAYAVPYEKSEWKTNPLWHDWGPYEEEEEDWSYSRTGVSSINPIKLKRIIFKVVVGIVKASKTDFFYFKPTDKQRGKIYSNLTEKLLEALGAGWSAQNIENTWFYFYYNDCNL